MLLESVILAVGALVGALLGVLGGVAAMTAAPVALAAGSVTLVLNAGRIRLVVLALAVVASVATHAAVMRVETLSPSLARWFATAGAEAAGPILVAGRIVEDASVSRAGGVRLLLDVTGVRVTGDRWLDLSGRVLVHVGGEAAVGDVSQWSRGRRVTAPVSFRWPAFTRNPGSPSTAWQALTRGYVLAGSIKSGMQVQAIPGTRLDEAARAVRQHVRRVTRQLFGDGTVAGAVVVAILIGDRAGLDLSIEERLMAAGTYHVLAISGGNIAVLTAAVVSIVGLVCRSFRVVSLVAFAVVAMYGWVVAGDPSVTRAVSAALVWLAVRAAGLDSRPLVAFGAVLFGVLMLQPLLVVDVGAWLSFGAVFGILVFAAPCTQRLVTRLPPGGGWRAVSAAASVAIVSVAVQAVLLPVGAVVFAQVALAGPIANLVAVPAMAVVQLTGVAAIAVAPVLPWVGDLAARIAAAAVWLIVESPRLLEWAPGLLWRVPPPPVAWLMVYYALVLLLAVPRVSTRGRVAAIAALVVTVAVLPWTPLVTGRRPLDGWLRVTVFDVGQGDSALVEFPGGRTLVVDGGNQTDTFDAGLRVVAPAIWARGGRRLDWVGLSHGDRDHAGGLPSLIRVFRPGEVWEGIPVTGSGARPGVVAAAEVGGVAWRELRRGDRFTIGGVTMEVLHPEIPDWERRRVRNDDSLVLRVRFGQFDMLLTGDVSAAVEASLADRLADPADRGAIRVLKVAHHGSRTSTSAGLLRAYAPWVGIVSVGRNNPFGHPAPETLDRLRAAGTDVFRTDRDGATTVESDGRIVQVTTWTGQSRRLVARRSAPPP